MQEGVKGNISVTTSGSNWFVDITKEEDPNNAVAGRTLVERLENIDKILDKVEDHVSALMDSFGVLPALNSGFSIEIDNILDRAAEIYLRLKGIEQDLEILKERIGKVSVEE